MGRIGNPVSLKILFSLCISGSRTPVGSFGMRDSVPSGKDGCVPVAQKGSPNVALELSSGRDCKISPDILDLCKEQTIIWNVLKHDLYY